MFSYGLLRGFYLLILVKLFIFGGLVIIFQSLILDSTGESLLRYSYMLI